MRSVVICLAVTLLAAGLSGCGSGCGVVSPGERGVVVTLGKVEEQPLNEGFHFIGIPVISDLHSVSVRQQRQKIGAHCFSSDLQEVTVDFSILYRIPETSVVSVFRDYHGDPFDTLVVPRAHESIKEVTASRSAEMIVKQREMIKTETLTHLREKVGGILIVEDLTIDDVQVSKNLADSIEKKMIQEQEAQKAVYAKQQATIDAEKAVEVAKGKAEAALIEAKAEAESIRIRGQALQQNPGVIQLQLIERWNGVTPSIVSSGQGSGVNILLPATTVQAPSK